MKKVKIVVDDECIQNGKPEDSRECPVALAMKGLFKDEVVCDVGQEMLAMCVMHPPYPPYRYPIAVWNTILPREARDAITGFDTNEGMVPFSFELEIDEKFLKE